MIQEKENVYAENSQTETLARATTGQEEKQQEKKETAPEQVSTDLGKFRSVDALLRAYEKLEAEFTRRSQRLKELEREADNLSLSELNGRGEKNGAEKLRKNAEQRKTETKAFDAFVSELEAVRAQKQSPEQTETEKPVNQTTDTLEQDVAESEISKFDNMQIDAKPSVAGGSGVLSLSHDALYELVQKDEGVRLKVIGEYLNSLGKSGAPLMTGGAGTLVAPPLKPKSINEAGSMVLRFLKRENAQA